MSVIMKKSRLPRFERVASPPKMILTSRDLEILKAVCEYRLLTREQVETLLFRPERGQDHATKTSIARKRLRLLFQHGYLDRIPMPTGRTRWGWRPVYRLTHRGSSVVAEHFKDVAATYQNHRRPELTALFLDHALRISDIRIAFSQAAARCGYRIVEWLDDWHLKRQAVKDSVTLHRVNESQETVAVIPDSFVFLQLGHLAARFYLEVDMATMTNKRWKTRVLAYRKYVESGKYKERYHAQSLRILTVTTSIERMKNLKRTTESAGGGRLFWFTTFDQVQSRNILKDPIWHIAGDLGQGPAALISE